MINKIIKGIRNPKRAILYILGTKISKVIPDKTYLEIKYKLTTGKKLDFENPKTFNEKLQWLKLHNRNPEYTTMVDKFEVRKYIADKIGEEYLIPLIGVYDSFEEIDFEVLPNQFVLKPNHTSGNVYICKDKSKINYKELKKEINMWLKRKYYWMHREWPYKNVKPKIVCEKYMVDESGTELKDYKMYCFNGETKIIQVDYDRFNGHKRNLYN
ncbi:glycosyl transferase, partial [Bacillus pacificus]